LTVARSEPAGGTPAEAGGIRSAVTVFVGVMELSLSAMPVRIQIPKRQAIFMKRFTR
jgi:hypothetical protein